MEDDPEYLWENEDFLKELNDLDYVLMRTPVNVKESMIDDFCKKYKFNPYKEENENLSYGW